jgi:hypothetical protein
MFRVEQHVMQEKAVSDTAKGEKELELTMDQWKHCVNSEAHSCCTADSGLVLV